MREANFPRDDPLVVARFWSKVRVGRPTECWEWAAKARADYGYGLFRPGTGGATIRAHRFAYELAKGLVGGGEVVRHTCDNPPCCNPAHLVSGTQADNIQDMHERGRRKYTSRLTDAQVAEIAARCRAGEAPSNVAREFGISTSYASLIKHGQRRASRLENGENNGW